MDSWHVPSQIRHRYHILSTRSATDNVALKKHQNLGNKGHMDNEFYTDPEDWLKVVVDL